MISDNFSFNKKSHLLGEKCLGCFDKSHNIAECPFLHFVLNKLILLSKFNFFPGNQRKEFIRKKSILFATRNK